MHSAVQALEAYAATRTPTCRAVSRPMDGLARTRARRPGPTVDAGGCPAGASRTARGRPGAPDGRPRDRGVRRRGGLGPAVPALRARAHGRPARPRAGPGRGDGARRGLRGGVADPGGAGADARRPDARAHPGQIMWPAEVFGCAAVVERFVLPPGADEQIPQDPAAAEQFAAAHPERQEVRIVAGRTRDGSTYCALRLKSHDDDCPSLRARPGPRLLELLLGHTRAVEQHPVAAPNDKGTS